MPSYGHVNMNNSHIISSCSKPYWLWGCWSLTTLPNSTSRKNFTPKFYIKERKMEELYFIKKLSCYFGSTFLGKSNKYWRPPSEWMLPHFLSKENFAIDLLVLCHRKVTSIQTARTLSLHAKEGIVFYSCSKPFVGFWHFSQSRHRGGNLLPKSTWMKKNGGTRYSIQ